MERSSTMTTEASAQVVTETAAGEPSQVLVDLPTSSETPPSDFVQVAQIEADKAITIAAIEAETEQARIEAASDGELTWQESLALIQEQQALLMGTVETLAATVQSLTAPLIPPISEPEGEDLTLTQEPMVIVEPEIPEAPPSTETEPHERNEDEKPVKARHAFMI